jgi:hypothetical protein
MKDIETLSLEKYVDEIAGAAVEGLARCKTERDIWGAVEVCCPLFGCLELTNKLPRLYLVFTADSPNRSPLQSRLY